MGQLIENVCARNPKRRPRNERIMTNVTNDDVCANVLAQNDAEEIAMNGKQEPLGPKKNATERSKIVLK